MNNLMFKNLSKTNFSKLSKKFFGHGPFNPQMYKYKLVSEKKLTYIVIKIEPKKNTMS